MASVKQRRIAIGADHLKFFTAFQYFVQPLFGSSGQFLLQVEICLYLRRIFSVFHTVKKKNVKNKRANANFTKVFAASKKTVDGWL